MEPDELGVRAAFFQRWDTASVATGSPTRAAFPQSMALPQTVATLYLPEALINVFLRPTDR